MGERSNGVRAEADVTSANAGVSASGAGVARLSVRAFGRAVMGAVIGLASLGLASGLDVGLARAQAAPTPAAATTDNGAQASGASVGEVLVTATRRKERLVNVPEAIAVVSGASIAAIGPIRNTSDVLNAVPGARFNNLGNPLLSEISIRGSGTERATGADSSVGLYANGVYIGASTLGGRNLPPIDSFDLNHVEVLEGPQGALYGRDAEYGVINLISQQPTFSNSASVDDIYSFETRQNIFTALINHPLNDHVSVRLGVQDYTQSGGFEYNPDRNTYYDHTSGYIVRGQVRFQEQNFDANLLVQRQQLQVPAFWTAQTILPPNPATGYPGGSPLYPRGLVQNPRAIAHNGNDSSEEDINNVLLTLNYDLGWAKATSSTSWRTLHSVQNSDGDLIDLPTEIAAQQAGEKGVWPFSQYHSAPDTTTWYEDLHLAGAPQFNGHLTWLVGFEYLYQTTNTGTTSTTNPCVTVGAPNLTVGQGLCTGTPTQPLCVPTLPGSTCPPVVNAYGSDTVSQVKYTSLAPYASLTYNIGLGFSLTGDVRYTNDRKTGTSNVTQLYTGLPFLYLTTGGAIPAENLSLDSGNFTYTVTGSYKLPGSMNRLLYAKVGTGYRVGGFNFGHTPPLLTPPYPAGITAPVYYAPITPSFGDETSISYEVGFKGEITRRSYFTIDTYFQTTKNALAAVGDGCIGTNACLAASTNYTVNAGTVRGDGVEAQFDTALNLWGGNLNLQLDGSNQFAKYVSNAANGPNNTVRPGLPVVGSSIAENPHWLANATLGYSHPITADALGFLNVHFHGQWGGIQDPQTTAGVSAFHLDDYQDVDLRTGVDIKKLEAALVVTNLTNEVHRIADFSSIGRNTLTGAALALYVQQRLSFPRTIALEFKYHW